MLTITELYVSAYIPIGYFLFRKLLKKNNILTVLKFDHLCRTFSFREHDSVVIDNLKIVSSPAHGED